MGCGRSRKRMEVIVVTGKDKGRRGEVLRVRDDGRVVVANVTSSRQKPNPNTGRCRCIIEREIRHPM